jgi:hypothetical protein
MLSEAAGQSLDKTKELVTNGLDLISFIFLSPFLVRTFRPVVGSFSSLLAWSIFGFVGAFAVGVVFQLIVLLLPYTIPDWVHTVVLFLGAIVIGLSLGYAKRFDQWLNARFAEPIINVAIHKSLLIGIALFFLSRIYAFVLAAHQVFG